MIEIPISGNKGLGYVALIDDEDYELVSRYNWNLKTPSPQSRMLYAQASVRSKILMHRLILSPPKGMVVDHIDHNGLNNTRTNLRICTMRQNSHNARVRQNSKSGFKGVHFQKSMGKWVAQHATNIGSFETAEEAARAYDKFVIENLGEFAYLNFPVTDNKNKGNIDE